MEVALEEELVSDFEVEQNYDEEVNDITYLDEIVVIEIKTDH